MNQALTQNQTQSLTTNVHRTQLKDFLVKQAGRFVGIDFIKQDGSHRSLTGRLGVRKHLVTGVEKDELGLSYVTVYDMKAKGYRSVNMATVSNVRAENMSVAIIG